MDQQNRSPRLGLIKDFFFERSTPEVQSHTEEVAQKLAQAGAVIEEVPLPDSFATAHSCQRLVSNVEAAAFHQQWYRDRADEYGPRIRGNIEMGLLVSGAVLRWPNKPDHLALDSSKTFSLSGLPQKFKVTLRRWPKSLPRPGL